MFRFCGFIYITCIHMLDEFTDDISIIYEFVYYLSLTALIKSLNKWIHLLTEFSSLDEIICSLITVKLTEFIVYVNPYVKWNHGTNKFTSFMSYRWIHIINEFMHAKNQWIHTYMNSFILWIHLFKTLISFNMWTHCINEFI